MNTITEQLAVLFRAAGKAHHEAYAAVDGADPDWPLWYTEFLLPKLRPLLNQTLTRSELVYRLVDVSKRQAADAPDHDWASYYAEYFAAAYHITFPDEWG